MSLCSLCGGFSFSDFILYLVYDLHCCMDSVIFFHLGAIFAYDEVELGGAMWLYFIDYHSFRIIAQINVVWSSWCDDSFCSDRLEKS